MVIVGIDINMYKVYLVIGVFILLVVWNGIFMKRIFKKLLIGFFLDIFISFIIGNYSWIM